LNQGAASRRTNDSARATDAHLDVMDLPVDLHVEPAGIVNRVA